MTELGAAPAREVRPASTSEGQTFCDLIAAPYNTHLGSLADLSDRAATVAALAPPRLVAVLRDGLAQALARYGSRLSAKTNALIADWLHEHVRLADSLSEPWGLLSEGASNEVVRHFNAGFSSPEAQAGLALGSWLGGVGSIAGGLVGAFLALHRDDQGFATRLRAYLGEIDRWFTLAAADFDRRLLPRVERDLNPWPYRARWALGAVVALGAAAAATWLAH